MSADVFLAKSHSWLYEKLTEQAVLDEGDPRLVETRRSADAIIYLDPPWPDADAPDRLRSFGPRDLLRTFVYSQRDVPFAWAPGMYTNFPSSRANAGVAGSFYVTHHHREPGGLAEDLEAARGRPPDLLWSFMGTLANDQVRQRLREIDDPDSFVKDTQQFSDEVRWGWGSTHLAEGRAAFSEYAASLGRSAFVLCPRGIGPGSIRLFEVLQVGRCPVVISDDWLPPPFVDWEACSIRVPEARIHDLPKILREREPQAGSLGRAARLAWEQFFSPERQLQTLLRGCLRLDGSTSRRLELMASSLVDDKSLRRVMRKGKQRLQRLNVHATL